MLVKRISKEIVFREQDRISDYADFNLTFGGSSDAGGSEGILIILTEYWVGDDEGNQGLEDEVLIERDRPAAEKFAEELNQELGNDFRVKVYCGHW